MRRPRRSQPLDFVYNPGAVGAWIEARTLSVVVRQIISAMVVLAVCLGLFWALGRRWPCNPDQKPFSKAMVLDLAYCAVGVVYAGLAPAGAALMASALLSNPKAGLLDPWLANTPLLVQAALLLISIDFCQYWLHRALHSRWFWPFHAIHHSARDVHWTATFRVHPINYLIYNVGLSLLARFLGFAADAFLIAGPVAFLVGVTAHANLNWDFGPLRRFISSPRFHRWHHTAARQTHDKNFAPLFPVWDLLFGTFFLPRGDLPRAYGVSSVPDGFLGQLAHPFRGAAWGVEPRSRPRLDAAAQRAD